MSEGFAGIAHLWVATWAGLFEVDGLFSTFSGTPYDECINIARRFDGALWIGTRNGIYRQDAQGRLHPLTRQTCLGTTR